MKGRLIRKDKDMLYLDNTGKIRNADNDLLYNLLFGFKTLRLKEEFIGFWNTELPEMTAVEGETLCYITDSNQLVIIEPEAFQKLFVTQEMKVDEFLTVKEYAEKHSKSTTIIKKMCNNGLLRAKKLNGVWFIEDQPYPIDKRVKTGKHIKE
jgi:hypothetical protein